MGMIFLVISCPCALVISIPLTFFGGIGLASRRGILIKGSNYLDAVRDIKCIAFDKTGTLTEGVFEVQKILSHEITEEKLIEIAAYAENYSNHPIAKWIKIAYGKNIDIEKIVDEVENVIHNSMDKEISSSSIGEIVMEKLKELDEVAYVRFASIYREFKDVNTFMSEIKKILEK